MTETVLLALDTSTEFCSVALLVVANPFTTSLAGLSTASSAATSTASSGRSSGEMSDADVSAQPRVWVRHEATGAVSSTRVLPAIRELFDEAGFALAACNAIAFGAGPGSFTGLRTATGVAQGLAFGLGCPVVPVSTLAACAESARRRDPGAKRVLAALDARMDEVYWADYAWDDALQDWRTVRAAALDAPQRLVAPDTPYTLAGNAARVFGERLAVAAGARSIDGEALPHALPIAYAALRAWRAGRAVPADQAAPEYVRDKVALTTAERLAAKSTQATQATQATQRAQEAQEPQDVRGEQHAAGGRASDHADEQRGGNPTGRVQ